MSTGLKIDQTLLSALISGVQEGLQMTGITPEPVGASRFFTASREVSILVGLIGKQNGTLTINLSQRTAAWLAGQLLDEETFELTDESIDGICEIGNMIAGSAKTLLLDTDYEFEAISCPALIMGANYNLYHYRGVITASAEFEISELPVVSLKDRFFSVSICLMRQ